MSEPSRLGEGFERAIASLGRVWVETHAPRCTWCRRPFGAGPEDDLRQYVAWCMALGKLIDPKQKRLPPARVFCNSCAPGAISELVDGISYAAPFSFQPPREVEIDF